MCNITDKRQYIKERYNDFNYYNRKFYNIKCTIEDNAFSNISWDKCYPVFCKGSCREDSRATFSLLQKIVKECERYYNKYHPNPSYNKYVAEPLELLGLCSIALEYNPNFNYTPALQNLYFLSKDKNNDVCKIIMDIFRASHYESYSKKLCENKVECLPVNDNEKWYDMLCEINANVYGYEQGKNHFKKERVLKEWETRLNKSHITQDDFAKYDEIKDYRAKVLSLYYAICIVRYDELYDIFIDIMKDILEDNNCKEHLDDYSDPVKYKRIRKKYNIEYPLEVVGDYFFSEENYYFL